MSTVFKLFILVVAMLMVGCTTLTRDVIVYKDKVILVVPSDDLLADCDITNPPAKEAYPLATLAEKEKILGIYSRSLLSDLGKCNAKNGSLRNWKKKQLEIHKTN